MSEILKLIKPYEISVWGDRLVEAEDNSTYFEEVKLAVIGSNTMTALNRVSSPILKINTNGEKTLTFSLNYYYFDELVGDFVVNPFSHWLVNERKIKLKYDNEWYDFVLKERVEDSETYEFQYTCTDAFTQELARNGYDVTFNVELNNNLGTITELAEETLKNTDWIIDKENSDLLRQTVSEPIYTCTLTGSFTALNLDTNTEVTITSQDITVGGETRSEKFYIFYSYVINETKENVQFIRETDIGADSYDDNNALHLTNYRYTGIAVHDKNAKTVTLGGGVFHVEGINLESQAYRLAYNSKTTYDPIMGYNVEILEAELEHETQQIYSYKENEYSTSGLAVSYIANGSNFTLYDSTTKNNSNRVVGWDNQCVCDSSSLPLLQFTTRPKIDPSVGLVGLDNLNEVVGYLQFEFLPANPNNKYANAFYNQGITANASVIDHIAKGDEYVFRIRYGWSDDQDGTMLHFDKAADATVRAVVAKYNLVDKALDNKTTIKVKEIDKNNIFFDFTGPFIQKNSTIKGGELRNNDTLYVIDEVVQTPSLKYAYQVANGDKYVWNPSTKKYVIGTDQSSQGRRFMPYHYTVAAAKQSLSHATLSNPNENIGLFLYSTKNTKQYVFVEDVSFFKKILDAEGNVVFPGEAPIAQTIETTYYYLKPDNGAFKDEIKLYKSPESLASDLAIDVSQIKKLYNENCEKILSIEVEHSNYFNILQSLCETFECWVRFEVAHNNDGSIKLDENHKQIKKVVFKEFVGKPNYAGFKYDINLNSIQRTIDSSEFVTKLIVGSSASDYTDNGMLTIADAPSNTSGESFIYNFNYYLKQGLVNKEEFNKDLNELYEKIKNLNSQLVSLREEYILASNSLTKLEAQRNVFVTTLDEANSEVIKSLEEFKTVTNEDYETYIYNSGNSNNKANDDNILEIFYRIYANASMANNYAGIVTNIKTEYNELNLRCNGAETYSASVVTSNGTQETSSFTKLTLSGYFEGFSCDFLNGGEVVESFKSGYNSNTFTSDVAYDTIKFTSIPNNYQLEYYDNGRHVVCTDVTKASLKIYDTRNHEGLTRRFKLVPTEEFFEAHPGLKKEIEEKEKAKQQLLNDFQSKYSKFIQEGTWDSTDYISSELYYLDAVQVSNTSAQPKVTYTINVAEVSEQEGLENYFFSVGDKTYVEDVRFFGAVPTVIGDRTIYTPVKEEVIVSEVEWHLDDPAENIITVQNYKTQFEDLFQRINATVQAVQYNSASYSRAASIFDENGNINADLLISSLNGLSGQSYDLASGGAVRATKEGLIVRDLTSTKNYIIIKSGGIERSTDGGYTWEKILSADGIAIDALKAGTIDTTQISIMDGDNPSFRWDKSGLSAFGYEEEGGYDLNTFVRFDKYGLYGIKQGGDYVVKSIEDLQDKAHFGITWDGFFIKNSYTNGYVSISSDNDFQVMRKIESSNTIYVSTEDTEIVEDKEYYTLETNITYDEVVNPDLEDLSNYYEYDENNNEYVLTEDIAIDSEKIYYIQDIYETYELVNVPQVEDLSLYYETEAGTEVDYTEKIKIGALEFDDEGQPIKYGINIRNDNGAVVFTTDDNGDLVMAGTIYASAGHIGGMEVNSSMLSMDTIVLEPNKGIYSTNTVLMGIKPIYEWQWEPDESEVGGQWVWVDTGRTEPNYEPVFIISDEDGSATFNNARVRGEINAGSGNFYGMVTVGKDESNNTKPYIIIDGRDSNDATISSSKYVQDGASYGWMINSDGDAVFNNITARGAIKTAVFEYSEIQAVGGVFIFRPSSTIKAARISGNNLILKVDKPYLFATIKYEEVDIPLDEYLSEYYEKTNYGYFLTEDTTIDNAKTYYERQVIPYSWCKVSNYTNNGAEPDISSVLSNNGLSHVYEVLNVDLVTKEITLSDAAQMVVGANAITTLGELEGGALIDMGRKSNSIYYDEGVHNYGIGINSSDNTVNLPARAISLFETVINDTSSIKVSYNYRGIFGTLPQLPVNKVRQTIYPTFMEGTQGIYTDNMYIGDGNEYLAFYTDNNGDKHLKISAKEIVFYLDPNTGEEITWEDKINDIETTPGPEGPSGPAGEDAISVKIISSVGESFVIGSTNAILTCYVYQGTTDITNTVDTFTWSKYDKTGTQVAGWTPAQQGVEDGLLKNQIYIDSSDVDAKSIFYCDVIFA